MRAFAFHVMDGRSTFFQGFPSATHSACSDPQTSASACGSPPQWPSSGSPWTHLLPGKVLRSKSPRGHATILCSPLIKGCVAHTMLMAQISHRHTAFTLSQDRKDLGCAVSCHLHSKSPHASCRENSTSAVPYFRGGLPPCKASEYLPSAAGKIKL